MYDNLDDLINSFCNSCRNKKVNSDTTVEKQIRDAFQCVFRNNVADGYFMLAGAMVTLQDEGGCHTCISILQALMNNFQE
jgi:Fe-S cluster biogenesis protein NfuA